MATNTLIQNIMLPVFNADETPFHGLALRRFTVESVVMSLGDKITGDVYYPDNNLLFTMQEYVVYNGVKYVIVNPPTIVKEGMVADNSELKGMTKYSLEFYHPMYQLGNMPFSDVAVTSDESRYLSESKKFNWIGKPNDFIAKINKNLEDTQWAVVKSSNFPSSVNNELSDVIPFEDATIADALKTMNDTWKIPYVVDVVASTDPLYAQGKRFKVVVGLPAEEIYPEGSQVPYVFRLGSGVGLKNNSRTPRNNKIVTRIAGYGSERNIPYGYPQVIWYGDQTWKYTINNDGTDPLSYSIYDGIVGGKWVKLIKHPFTRTHLMPKVYVERLFNKVSPYAVRVVPAKPSYTKMLDELYDDINNKLVNYSHAGAVNDGFDDLKSTIQTVVANGVAGTYEFGDAHSLQYEGKVVLASNGIISGEMYADDNNYPKFDGYTFKDVWAINTDSGAVANTNYDPTLELIDYYDAVGADYPNQINPAAPSYESHEFEDVYPRLNEEEIVSAVPYNGDKKDYIEYSEISALFTKYIQKAANVVEDAVLTSLKEKIANGNYYANGSTSFGGWWSCTYNLTNDEAFMYFEYKSVSEYNTEAIRFSFKALKQGAVPPAPDWDDTMDDKGEYIQSYFKLTIPQLTFDVYACASITEQMDIYMRSGACIGCTFPVQVDWDDYKLNFFDKDGNFCPDGAQRDLVKYPKSNEQSITVIVQKDINTFGTLMPNRYQQPQAGDEFVFLGISLPSSYISTAEEELENKSKEYMLDNNIYYFDYPVKLSEHFLENHKHILSQIKPNAIMRFEFAGEQKELFIKQVSTKVGFTPLPQYEITLTDNVEVVLNQIGETAERVSRLETLVGMLDQEELKNIWAAVQERLSKVDDDTAKGFIRFIKGLQVGENFTSGILGEGGVFRMNGDGTSYLEVDKMYVRMKAYFDNVEVKDYQHSSGNRMVTKAGAKICRVEWVDSQGEYVEQLDVNLSQVVKFRCFFKADNGEDTVRNDFVVDANGQQDLVYCNRTVIESGINKRWYWRAAIAKNATMTGEGEAWIDLSVTDCATDSDIPMAGDDIIQLGNRTDADRQGAIVEYVGGEDAPSYQIFQGINTYNLNNKNYISLGYSTQTNRAYMNVYGDAYIGDHQGTTFVKYEQVNSQTNRPKLTIKAEVDIQSTFGGQSLRQRVEQYAPPYDDSWIQPAIDAVQAQIDGELDTYYLAGVPSLQLPPVVSTQAHPYDDPWLDGTETAEERQAILNDHVGDLYYDKNTGYVYRFLYDDDNDTFLWTQIHDDAISEALRIANDAQYTADGKSTIFLNNPEDQDTSKRYPTNYKKGDSWVLPSGSGEVNISNTSTQRKFKYGSILTTDVDMASTGYNPTDWSEKVRYTDDTALTNFVNNTFAPFSAIIKGQVDEKSETWYQASDPSTDWDTNNKKIQHVGDIWCDTSANGGKKTYIWVDNGTSANPRFEWKPQDVPDEVFDKIDGKADIFVSKPTAYNRNDMWIIENGIASSDTPTGCQAGDIVIADNLPSGTDKRTDFVVGDWRKKDRYTDDTKYNNFITALLNGMPSGSTETTVEAALNAIKAALNQGTTISGGLVLSTLIGLRDSNSVLWAGINGQYDANALGKGIAGWYGGAMADMGNMTDAQIEAWEAKTEAQKAADSSWAKTLFRFDGSGYLAANNIYWNAGGAMTIKNLQTIYGTAGDSITINALSTLSGIFLTETYGSFNNTELLVNPQNAFSHLFINRTGNVVTYPSNLKTINDYAVLNFGEMKARFVTVDFFNALFQAKDSSGNTIAVNTANPLVDSIKSLVGFWTESYLSALGQNSSGSGGGGGVDMTTVWTAMSQPTTEQINVTHLSNALASYSTKLETIQNITVGTGANVGSYVVTRANGSNFTIGACNVVDIADYESTNGVLPIGNVMYVYEGMPVEYRRCSRQVSQQVTESYMIFAVTRYGTYDSGYPYPQELYVFKRTSGSSSFIYDETVNWDDAASFMRQLFGDDLYLPLTGGQMSSQSLVEDLNADLLDGYHASAFLLKTGGTINDNTDTTIDIYSDGLTFKYSGAVVGSISIEQDAGDYYLDISAGTTIGGNTIIHSGNIGSQSVNYATAAGSAPASDVYSWAKAATKPSYTLDEVSDGTTRKLSNYLPLTGGTMTGAIDFANTNNRSPRIYCDSSVLDMAWNYTHREGAGLSLYSVDAADVDKGVFYLWADNGTNRYHLIGKGDGTLRWESNYIIHSGNWASYIGTQNSPVAYASLASSAGSAGSATYATSAGNADTVDGYHAGDFLVFNNTQDYVNCDFVDGNIAEKARNTYIEFYQGGWMNFFVGQLYAANGVSVYYNNSLRNVIHEGNIGSQSVAYATSAGSVAWTSVSGRPTNVSSFTNDSGYITSSALGSYLPLSGGTMTGSLYISGSDVISFDVDNSIYADSYGADTRLYINGYSGIYLAVNHETQGGVALPHLDISDNGISTNSSISATGNIYMNSNLVATQTWVGNQGYLTSASLNGYATQTWVGQNYLALSGGTLTGSLIIGGSDIPEEAANLASYASSHSIKFYRNGFLIPYQMDNTNDGGFFRVRGTTEDNVVCEIGTWDDYGTGETIQFNYYPTTSTINPTYSVSVPKATGTLALTSQIPTAVSQLSNDSGYITSSGSCNYATSASVSALLKGNDNRSTNNIPSWYMSKGAANLYVEFSNSGSAASSYSGYGLRATFTPWYDNTGGRPVQLEFNDQNVYIRGAADDNSWNSWRTIIDSGNIGSQSVSHASTATTATTATYATYDTEDNFLASEDWVQQQGYITSSGNAGSATKLQTARTIWGQSFDGTANVNGTLYVKGSTNWCEGIRIENADNGWTTLILGASGSSGTNANAWSLHTYQGNFYLANNGSDSFTNGISCVNGNWSILSSGNVGIGTSSPYYKLQVNGTTCLGDTSSYYQYPNRGGSEGGAHHILYGSDCDYGVVKIRHTSDQGSGSPGSFSASLAIFDERADTIAGGFQPTFYINRTGATRVPDIMGCDVGGTRIFTIQSGGNVGIGTTSPSYKLDVAGSARVDGAFVLTDNTYFIGSSSYGFRFNSNNDAYNNFIIYDNGNTYTRGNVGIGTTSPTDKLHVVGRTVIEGTVTGASTISSDLDSLVICPKPQRTNSSNSYYSGIAFNHLYNYDSSEWYRGSSPQAWIGTRLVDTNGSELDALVFATKEGTGNTDRPIERMCILPNGNVGIGTTSPSYKLDVNGNLKLTGSDTEAPSVYLYNSATGTGAKINFFTADYAMMFSEANEYDFDNHVHVDGDINATGGIYGGSDVRRKNIYDYNALVDVNTIAMAPAVRFKWNDGVDDDLHCGSIAQYWYSVMPECVRQDRNGYLSMQYDVIALLASISIAKKVMNHEERITELEKENERLRTELEQLRV